MSLLRKSGSYSAFRFDRKSMPDAGSNAFCDALAKARFRNIDLASTEEVSCGWTTPDDPSGGSFDTYASESMDAGPAAWVRIRCDSKKLPKERVAQHVAAWAKAHGKKPTAKQRKELKQELADAILPKMLPATKNIDVLIFDDGFALVFTAGKSGIDTARKLWRESFGHELQPFASGSDAPDDGLGEEFLRWLWFRSETGLVDFVAVCDSLSFFDGLGGTQAFKGGSPTMEPEARMALRDGKRLAKAGFVIAIGDYNFNGTIVGESLRVSARFGDVDDADNRTVSRAHGWRCLHESVARLYSDFLQVRASGWQEESEEMAKWMRGEK